MNEKSKKNRKPVVLNANDLPIYIKYQGSTIMKEYILKGNKKKDSILLNKKEY